MSLMYLGPISCDRRRVRRAPFSGRWERYCGLSQNGHLLEKALVDTVILDYLVLPTRATNL